MTAQSAKGRVRTGRQAASTFFSYMVKIMIEWSIRVLQKPQLRFLPLLFVGTFDLLIADRHFLQLNPQMLFE